MTGEIPPLASAGEPSALVLEGVFRHLVRRGAPLSVRDYLDALRALRAGYGFGDRRRLERLCRVLWARSEEESRVLDRLFTRLPPPSEREVAAWSRTEGGMYPTEPPAEGREAAPEQRNAPTVQASTALTVAVAAIRFEPAGQLGLRVQSAPGAAAAEETFVLTERPPVAVRSMILAWRRFQRPQRSGPRVEPDFVASIDARSRRGFLTAPVLVARRRNQAQLTLLIDQSPSMAPWRRFTPTFLDALARSRLHAVRTFYFDNLPEDGIVFADPGLTSASHLLPALTTAPGPLLVLSDAGAARRQRRGGRVRATADFLDRIAAAAAPVAWLNPMPRWRWHGTTAEAIDRVLHSSMFPLDERGLIGAVDVLRGLRESR